MKKINKLLSFVLVLALILSSFSVYAQNFGNELCSFFYLEPCEEFVFELQSDSVIADEFDDNAVIVVLNRTKSRTTSMSNRDFTTSDFRDVGAVYVEDLIRLASWENIYAQRFWTAEQQVEMMQRGFSVNQVSPAEAEHEYLQARTDGEANTMVNFDEFRRILLIRLEQNCRENVLNAVRLLQQREYVISAVPNFKNVSRSYVSNPNDHYFRLPSNDVNHQWAVNRIGLPGAWGFIGNNPTSVVSVGIMGHGVGADHPELAGRVSAGTYGSTTHTNWGNHSAGIIGARGNNNATIRGIAGISWNVQLVSLGTWGGFRANAVRAINDGRTHFIPILTHSFDGGHPGCPLIPAVLSYTGLFVHAGGNDGLNRDYVPEFPGVPNVLNIGASDMIDNRSVWNPWSSSCYGLNSIHLFAPGGGLIGHTNGSGGIMRNIRTTGPVASFEFYSGTSAAAPHVAGVAALLLSVRPDATTQQLMQAIMDGVDFVPALNGMSIANGRLNAHGALMALLDMPTIEITTSVPNLSFDGTRFTTGTIRLNSQAGLSNTSVYVRVNRRNASNAVVGTYSGFIRLNTNGNTVFTPGTAVRTFNANEHLEISVYRDSLRQVLFNRQFVRPVNFSF